jgi:hypothetical protein
MSKANLKPYLFYILGMMFFFFILEKQNIGKGESQLNIIII